MDSDARSMPRDRRQARAPRAPEHTWVRQDVRRGPFGTVSVCDVVMRPGLRTRHTHEGLHLCFVVRGAFEQVSRSRSTCMDAAMVRVSPPATPAELRFGPLGAHCFLIELDGLDPDDRRHLTPSASVFLSDVRTHALALGVREAFGTTGEAPLVLETLALELFACAAHRPRLRPAPHWLRRVRDWLRDRYAEPLTLSEAAVTFGITPVHLSRTFREQYGCTMGAYLRAVRAEHVRRALARRERPLAQIALDAGFCDQSHMTRVFRQAFGITPGAYRRAIGST